MNTDQFQTEDDRFELPGFTAFFAFKTAGSIGFDLAIPRPAGAVTRPFLGHMEVHAPCSGDFTTRLTAYLPGSRDLAGLPEQERHQRCRALMQRTFDQLQLGADELRSYQATFIFPDDSVCIMHLPDILWS